VSRIVEAFAGAISLLAATSAFSQTPGIATKPEVAISVYDYAHVSPKLLVAAEEDARRIFLQAGVDTVWTPCLPKPEKIEAANCYSVNATHLTLKILPRAISAQARDRSDVLGTALLDGQGVGYYSYVFYEAVQRIADERKLGHAMLGDVLAHEIGHLLLGSNSHSVSGIMSAHWYGEELRRISEAAMLFTPSQSRILRDRLESHKAEVRVITSAKALSPAATP
jgi:hypothetical protein